MKKAKFRIVPTPNAMWLYAVETRGFWSWRTIYRTDSIALAEEAIKARVANTRLFDSQGKPL